MSKDNGNPFGNSRKQQERINDIVNNSDMEELRNQQLELNKALNPTFEALGSTVIELNKKLSPTFNTIEALGSTVIELNKKLSPTFNTIGALGIQGIELNRKMSPTFEALRKQQEYWLNRVDYSSNSIDTNLFHELANDLQEVYEEVIELDDSTLSQEEQGITKEYKEYLELGIKLCNNIRSMVNVLNSHSYIQVVGFISSLLTIISFFAGSDGIEVNNGVTNNVNNHQEVNVTENNGAINVINNVHVENNTNITIIESCDGEKEVIIEEKQSIKEDNFNDKNRFNDVDFSAGERT